MLLVLGLTAMAGKMKAKYTNQLLLRDSGMSASESSTPINARLSSFAVGTRT